MKTRKMSFDRPMVIVVDIENDEPGRPTEVVPKEMFPKVRATPLPHLIRIVLTRAQ
jgi:hypothetical protein